MNHGYRRRLEFLGGSRDFSAAEEQFAGEFAGFLMDNKKWWLLPIIVVQLLTGLLVTLGSSGAAPFMYTLF